MYKDRQRDLEFNYHYVGEIIKQSGLSQREFAKKYEVPYGFITGVRHKKSLPLAQTAMRYSHVFPQLRVSKNFYRNQNTNYEGNIAKEARLRREITVQELALETGVHWNTIAQLERGVPWGKLPRESARLALEDALDIEIPQNPRYLDEWEVYDILTSLKSVGELCEQYNRSRKVICDILSGRAYKSVYEDVFGKKE